MGEEDSRYLAVWCELYPALEALLVELVNEGMDWALALAGISACVCNSVVDILPCC